MKWGGKYISPDRINYSRGSHGAHQIMRAAESLRYHSESRQTHVPNYVNFTSQAENMSKSFVVARVVREFRVFSP